MCSQDLTIVDIASMGYVNWFCNDGNPKLVRISKKLFPSQHLYIGPTLVGYRSVG